MFYIQKALGDREYGVFEYVTSCILTSPCDHIRHTESLADSSHVFELYGGLDDIYYCKLTHIHHTFGDLFHHAEFFCVHQHKHTFFHNQHKQFLS